ncbi:hypothetical protein SAMN05421504_102132 [Amycolatopsis xylanica]|uniref:Secreted protein n=1 Tax=Amycolatopsis xylanica TaxID=589385 RepID=A0A1H2YH43_9PSEU|nr:hypothetical protein [Amycolatopsis xylanica]SDX04400.1 hypothetical protein SAMN05421504_102132 [Amycolatopsis xylanica]
MDNRIKAATAAVFAMAGVLAGPVTAASANAPIPGQDCQYLAIKRTPPAQAIANCNRLDDGFTIYSVVIVCEDGEQHQGNWAPPHRVSTARCPEGIRMTGANPFIAQM